MKAAENTVNECVKELEELQTNISANSKERQRLRKRKRAVKAKMEREQADSAKTDNRQ